MAGQEQWKRPIGDSEPIRPLATRDRPSLKCSGCPARCRPGLLILSLASNPHPHCSYNHKQTPHIKMSTQGPEHTSPASDACPVDEKTRLAWMKANPGASRPGAPAAPAATSTSKANGCDSEEIDQSSPSAPPGLFSRWFSSAPPPPVDPSAPSSGQQHALGTQRVVSTIPRASPVDNTEGAKPANSEKESGVSEKGNWIYPSEKMFFDAMKRKAGIMFRMLRGTS